MQIKIMSFLRRTNYDHYENRMCDFCDENYCQVCTRYLSKGMHGLCRSCLATAAEQYKMQK